jgi:hypothetical protein
MCPISPDAPPPALVSLVAAFRLSPFERDVLLLCAGIELDAGFAAACGRAQGDGQRTHPTFSLALAALPGAHWSALTPAGPLRRWRLIEAGGTGALTLQPLRIDERILHYLTGVDQPDERLAGIVAPLPPTPFDDLVPSHRALADQIASAWLWAARTSPGPLPALQLCGADGLGKRAIARAASAALGYEISVAAADALPTGPAEMESLLRLWEREAVLGRRALLLDADDLPADPSDAARAGAVTRLIERAPGPLIVVSRERRAPRQRPLMTYDVRKPTPPEQRILWRAALGERSPGASTGTSST